MTAVIEVVDGIVIDPDARSFSVCGVRLPVAIAIHDRWSPPVTPADKASRPAEFLDLIRQTLGNERYARWLGRTSPSTPEAWHINLLCGENGWWVEVAIYPESPGYTPGAVACRPGEVWPTEDITAEGLLRLYRETCARHDAPDLEDDDPFGGLDPGTWEC